MNLKDLNIFFSTWQILPFNMVCLGEWNGHSKRNVHSYVWLLREENEHEIFIHMFIRMVILSEWIKIDHSISIDKFKKKNLD